MAGRRDGAPAQNPRFSDIVLDAGKLEGFAWQHSVTDGTVIGNSAGGPDDTIVGSADSNVVNTNIHSCGKDHSPFTRILLI